MKEWKPVRVYKPTPWVWKESSEEELEKLMEVKKRIIQGGR